MNRELHFSCVLMSINTVCMSVYSFVRCVCQGGRPHASNFYACVHALYILVPSFHTTFNVQFVSFSLLNTNTLHIVHTHKCFTDYLHPLLVVTCVSMIVECMRSGARRIGNIASEYCAIPLNATTEMQKSRRNSMYSYIIVFGCGLYNVSIYRMICRNAFNTPTTY